MHLGDRQRKWRGGAISAVALMALIVVVGILSSGGARADFNPWASIDISDDAAGANADLATGFGLPTPDPNYAELTSFTPAEWGVATDEDVPDGEKVGTLHADSTLGLLNNPCITPFPADFDLYEATTDITNSFSYDTATEPVTSLAFPGYDLIGGLERGIVEYPEFVIDLLGSIQPRSRSWGHTIVAGNQIIIQFIVFEPGDLPGTLASRGYASVTILNDPGASLGPSSITDFCTPLGSTTTIFGLSEGGYPLRTNPSCQKAGGYTFSWTTASMPDADGDGWENELDTCAVHSANQGDPRVAGDLDNDFDGIGNECDPTPNVDTGVQDHDGDGYQNRQDNCPLVPNGQLEDNQQDDDLDGIGDACEPDWDGDGTANEPIVLNPNSPDGSFFSDILEEVVDIDGPPCGEPGEDTDGDGFLDTVETELGSCWDDPCDDEEFCSDTEAADSTPEDVSVAGSCTDGEDNDLDGYVDDVDGGCGDDTDGDGVSDEGEDELGSDPDDADSTPEDASVCDVCTDSVDNDGDGDIDAADAGCAEEEVTPTPTVEAETPTPTVEAETPTPTVEAEYCSPVFPGTYNGLVRVDGQPAASGYEVTASIDGVQWGNALVSGGRYAMDIPDYLPTEPPCFEGGTITFALDAMECTPTADWASGIHNVDLSCAVAPPVTPTPEVTPTLTPTPTITPTTVPPTGAGGLSGSGTGLPLWAMALAGWAGLMIVTGLGTLVAAKRR